MTSNSLRVLIVTLDYPPPPGGIQTVAKNLEEGLSELGHVSRVLHLPPDDYDLSVWDFLPRRQFACSMFRPREFLYSNAVYRRTVDSISTFDPDIVHAMHVKNSAALIAANERDVPSILSTHALELQNERLSRKSISDADLVHTPSNFTATLVKDLVPDAQTVTIPPSVRVSEYRNTITEQPESSGGPVVTIARFVDRKNIETVIEAWSQLESNVRDDREFIVVGDGPNRGRLERAAEAMDDVRFTGWISEQEKRELLARADAFVMVPRRDGYDVEGFGIVYLEAQAARTPIVGSRHGGVPEAVDGAGLLVDDENDVSEVSGALETVLMDNDIQSQLLSEIERRIWRFDVPIVTSSHINVYQNIVS